MKVKTPVITPNNKIINKNNKNNNNKNKNKLKMKKKSNKNNKKKLKKNKTNSTIIYPQIPTKMLKQQMLFSLQKKMEKHKMAKR